MNKRERMLLILVAVAAGGLVVKVVVGKYSGTLKGYDSQIRQLKKEMDNVKLEETKAQIARLQWLEAGEQTLSMDANEATTRFREELEKLGDKSKLSQVEVSLGSTSQPWQKKGVRVLNASLTGQGSFEEVVGFLFELHRQPYAVRVKSLTLDQVSKPTQRNAKPANPGVLKMTLYVDTLLLPSCEMVAQITPAVLDEANRKPTSRPAEATLAGYKSLIDKKLFQPYEPERVVRPRDPRTPTTRVAQGPNPTPPPPPPPPPPRDAEFVLGRLLSSPRGQLAVLEDRARHGEDEYKEVGEEMYGGTLIFVHPTGAVTEKDGQMRFHAIDKALRDCKPLTENEQPELYEELMKLEKKAAGISARME